MEEKLRILILEDSVLDADLLEFELKESQVIYNSKRVENRIAFEHELYAFDPDVVLSDYYIPGFDVISAMELVRKEKPMVPFIFVTGMLGEEKAIELVKCGATDYVQKDKMYRLVPTLKKALKQGNDLKKRIVSEKLLELQLKQASALSELGQYVLAGHQLEQIIHFAEKQIQNALPLNYCQIVLHKNTKNIQSRLTPLNWQNNNNKEDAGDFDFQDADNKAVIENLLAADETVIVENISESDRFLNAGEFTNQGFKSFIGAKISDGKNITGFILAKSAEEIQFSQDDIGFIQTVSNILASAIKRNICEYIADFQLFILENVNKSVIVTELDGTVIYWNSGIEKLLGFTEEEMADGHVSRILAAENQQALSKAFIGEPAEKFLKVKGHFLRKDGELVGVKIKSQLIELNGKKCRLAFVTDITKKVKAREALIKNEANLNAIIENTCDAIWAVDKNGKIITSNAVSRKLFSSIFNINIETGLPVFSLLPPENREIALNNLNKVLKGERLILEREFKKRDNNTIYAEVYISPIITEDNEITGASFFARDITSRKIVENELSGSVERYKHLFEENPLPMWIWNNDTLQFLAVNKAALKHYGYSRNEFLSMNANDLRPADDKPDFHKMQRSMNEHTLGAHGTWKHVVKDGSIIDVEITSHLFDFNGKQARLVLSNDITYRIKAETALKESEANFKALIENTTDFIYSMDVEGRIVTANSLIKNAFGKGFKKGEIFTDFVAPEYVDDFKQAFKKVLNKERLISRFEQVLNGKKHYFEVSMNPIITDAGKVTGVTSFIRDITLQKLTEEEIIKSEKKYRSLIESMQEGVMSVDTDEIINFANPRFCEITGYTAEELIGKMSLDQMVDDKQKPLLEQQQQLRANGLGDQYELELVMKSGKKVWVIVNGIPIFDSQNKITGSLGTFTDISEIKKTEERLKNTNKELNTFIYKSSHDLKGPLSSIIGLTNLAKIEVDNEDAAEYFEMIHNCTKRLDSILTELVESLRIKEGSLSLMPVDFQRLMDEVLVSLKHMDGYNDMTIDVNIDKNIKFNTDIKIVRSVLQNLTENGIKYRNVSRNDSYFRMNIKNKEEGILIVAEDNGRGIPPEIQEKVFEMFYRGNTEAKGTGLGLYIVKSAIERLKGTIDLESEEGTCTKITIFLPAEIN